MNLQTYAIQFQVYKSIYSLLDQIKGGSKLLV